MSGNYFSRLTSREESQPSSSSSSTQASATVPATVPWAQLLRPLNLIECIRLESVSSAFFSPQLYSGQHRFVWNRKFQEYLFRVFRITRTEADVNTFLSQVAPKIGPFCRQLILKVHRMPEKSNFGPFTKLESLYLRVQINSQSWSHFFESPSPLPVDTLREICLVRTKDENYLPDNFGNFMQVLSPVLTSFQIWRSEVQFGQALMSLTNLRTFRFYLNERDSTLELFDTFARTYGKSLTRLYLHWVAPSITPSIVQKVAGSIAHFKALKELSVELNWTTFSNQNEFEWAAQKQAWKEFCAQMVKTIEKLSIDVAHNNFKSAVKNAELVQGLASGCFGLMMLRLVATEIGMFPLRITNLQVQTLEIVFEYMKIFREIRQFLDRSDYLPPYVDETCFLLSEFEHSNSVRVVKLVDCPLVDGDLLNHLAHHFPRLDKLYIQAMDQYSYSANNKMLVQYFVRFVDKVPSLRVLKLDDTYPKADLTQLVRKFVERAKSNAAKLFLLYIDKKKHVGDKEILKETLELFNLRVY